MNKFLLSLALSVSVAVGMSGCGGSGGSGDDSGGTPGGTPATSSPTLTVTTNTSTISAGSLATVTATVKDASGNNVNGALVTFEVADSALVTLIPSSGTALTSSGVATIKADAAGLSAAGATTITARATVDGATASGSVNVAVGAANVTLSGFSANLPTGQTSLSPYATTTITINVGGVATTTSVPVSFSSTCAAASKAEITATATSVNGVATANYTDKGCSGTDTITASVTGTSTTASLSLPVAAPGAAAIQYVSADPSLIVLKGTGDLSLKDSSLVKFKVVDNNNNPIANASVTLDLSTRTGGILLDSSSAAVIKQTDASGEVNVSVTAGTVPTPVWVVASHASGGNTFTSQSVKIQISTGRPVQDRFSISVSTFNIDGLAVDGITTSLSVIASDRVGNPVPDGTAINFISSHGQVQGTCQTTGGGGSCSVTYKSSGTRPADGRVTVVAYAIGDEDFRDDDGDNYRDATEPFNDVGDLYVDTDRDGAKDVGEQQINYSFAGLSCDANSIPGTIKPAMVAGTCDGAWGSAHVRGSSGIVLSGQTFDIVAATGSSLTTPSGGTGGVCAPVSVTFRVFDQNNNPLPFGTSLAVTSLPAAGWGAAIVPATVPITSALGGSTHTVTFTPAFVPCSATTGFSTAIKATTPSATPISPSLITVNP